MVAHRARGWLVYIAHFRQFNKADSRKRLPGSRNAGPILSCSVSNLAQNNEHWRVIVILAEMRDRPKEEHRQEYFGHLPQSGNHPYMGRKNEGESLMERAL